MSSNISLQNRTEEILKEAISLENKYPDRAFCLVSNLVNNNQLDWRVHWYLCKNSDYSQSSRLFTGGFKYCSVSSYEATLKLCIQIDIKKSLESEYEYYWKKQLENWVSNPGEFPIFIENSNRNLECIIGRPNTREIYNAYESGYRSSWWLLDNVYVSWFRNIPEDTQEHLRKYNAIGLRNAQIINQRCPIMEQATSNFSMYSKRHAEKMQACEEARKEKHRKEFMAFFRHYIDIPKGESLPDFTRIVSAIGHTIILSVHGSDSYEYAVPAKHFWD
jgi:hypothetical protein